MTFVTAEPYIGHLGLDGVGDTKGLMESEFRNRHIKWFTNARVKNVATHTMHVEELDDSGTLRKTHELPFAFAMMMPAFRGFEKLTNSRGFVLVDQHQSNPSFPNVFAVGVCVAIPPTGATPVPHRALGSREPSPSFHIQRRLTMTIDRGVLALAGLMTLAGALLTWFYGPWWLLLTGFFGLNLVQSSITGLCPAALILKKLGAKPGAAFQ